MHYKIFQLKLQLVNYLEIPLLIVKELQKFDFS